VIIPKGPASENRSSSKLNTAAISLEVMFAAPESLLMFAFLAGIEWELFAFNTVMAQIVQTYSFPSASIEESKFSSQAGGKWYRSTRLNHNGFLFAAGH
jgi:hypothetical protein